MGKAELDVQLLGGQSQAIARGLCPHRGDSKEVGSASRYLSNLVRYLITPMFYSAAGKILRKELREKAKVDDQQASDAQNSTVKRMAKL